MGKKSFEYFETEYQTMLSHNITSWNAYMAKKSLNQPMEEVDNETGKILDIFFRKPLMPQKGSIVEIGCGTGGIIRKVTTPNYTGTGIDVSKTALQIARQFSEKSIQYIQADMTKKVLLDVQYDIVIDGYCLHCLTVSEDRLQYLKNIQYLLKEGGIFICFSMCAPVNLLMLEQTIGARYFQNEILYAPLPNAFEYNNSIQLENGQWVVPTRKVLDWCNLVYELKKNDFQIIYSIYDAPSTTDMFGTFAAACTIL